MTGRRRSALPGLPAGRPPGSGVDAPGVRRLGLGTLTGGRQLSGCTLKTSLPSNVLAGGYTTYVKAKRDVLLADAEVERIRDH